MKYFITYCLVCQKITKWYIKNVPPDGWEEHRCEGCGQTFKYKVK